jgi:hypothetical protein
LMAPLAGEVRPPRPEAAAELLGSTILSRRVASDIRAAPERSGPTMPPRPFTSWQFAIWRRQRTMFRPLEDRPVEGCAG